jgi:hypothetical protein
MVYLPFALDAYKKTHFPYRVSIACVVWWEAVTSAINVQHITLRGAGAEL